MLDSVPVFIPRETANDDSVLILSWKVPTGSAVSKDDLICEVETSKALLEVHAPANGFVAYKHSEGQEVPIGEVLCWIRQQPPNPEPESISSDGAQAEFGFPARFSAAARLTAEQLGVSLTAFPPGAMVRRQDVLHAAGAQTATDSRPTFADPSGAVPIEWSPLPRRKEIERNILRRGRDQAIASSVTSVCRITHLVERLVGAGLPADAIQALIIFESSRLLRTFAEFNATYSSGRIGRYQQINIGWALDSGHGLVAPVIRDAANQSLREILECMRRQLDAYLEGAIAPVDLAGATFTITDLSSHGVSFFQPLLPEGQSAILGIGRQHGRGEEIQLYLTLVFDHQLAEGRHAAEFLGQLRARLEAYGVSPESMSPAAEETQYCIICQRDVGALQRVQAVLLKSEVPPGLICSMCVAGW